MDLIPKRVKELSVLWFRFDFAVICNCMCILRFGMGRKKAFLIAVLGLLQVTVAMAQNKPNNMGGAEGGNVNTQLIQEEPCGFNQVLKQLEQQYPGFKASFDAQTQRALQLDAQKQAAHVLSNRKKKVSDTLYYYDTVYTIPVVFHVIYNVANENLHDSLIISQLAVLNRDFNRLNADTVKTRSIFKSRAGSARIQFEFAKVDPNGVATNGIVRKTTTRTTFGSTGGGIQDLMKATATGGNDPWDPTKYLNIWVCDLSVNNQDALLGYAYPPYGHPSWTSGSWVADSKQGVVLHYKVVGRNNPRATGAIASANMGRCAVHEVGHFFGLRHIWADDQFSGNRCAVDDYIDDTPLQGIGAGFTCNLGGNTCIEPKNDLPDMFENYMDYSTEACQNIFTRRQVQMMRTSITDFRTELPIKREIITRMRVFDTVVYDEVLIYPVDQRTEVVVEVRNEDILDRVEVQFFDLLGQRMTDAVALKSNETRINTETWASGYYVAILRRAEDGKVIRKQKLFVD
jgi:predicted Zn-dependent protease with MMP-like domain